MEKLFFFDIDGTLIECNKGIYSIPQDVRDGLRSLQKKGHDVFLATGRCKCFIVDGVMDYPFSGYVTCNGAYVEYKGKEVYKKVVSQEAIKKTHELCLKRNLAYYFEGNDFIYVLNKQNPRHIEFKDNWGMKDKVIIDDFCIDEIETYIGMIVLNSSDDIVPMYEALSAYFDIQQHQSGLSFDLTLKGESKAKGIQKLVEALGKTMEDTVAFGDGCNDVEMISQVHLGIAMGNAVSQTKKVADFVTDNVDCDGIMKALEHFSFL